MRILPKLLLFFLTIAILVSIGGQIAATQSEQALIEKIGENSTDVAASLIHEVDRGFSDQINFLQSHVAHIDLAAYAQKSNIEFSKLQNVDKLIRDTDQDWISKKETPFIHEILNTELSNNFKMIISGSEEGYGYHIFSEIFLTNKYGVVIASSGRTTDYFQADEEWYQQALTEKNFWVGDVDYDKSAETFGCDIVLNIRDKDGNNVGVLKTVLNIAGAMHVVEKYQSTTEHSSQNTKLITRDGEMIYASEYDLPMKPLPERVYEKLSKSGGRGFFIDKGDIEGEEEELYSYAYSTGHEDYKGLGWAVIVEYELDDILAPVFEIRDKITKLLILTLILAALLSTYMAKSISGPLKKLSLFSETLDFDRLDQRIDMKRKDEIGDLATAINKMISNLQQTTVSKTFLDHIIDSMMDCLIVLSPTGTISKTNQTLLKLLQYEEHELHGKPIEILFAGTKNLNINSADITELADKGDMHNIEVVLLTKSGKPIPVLFSCSVMRSARGIIEGIVCAALDITERKQAEDMITYRALHDDLTKLPNRSMMFQLLEQETIHLQQNGHAAAIMFIDLDEFKLVNDTLGHPIGDELLKQAAQRLKTAVRDTDIVARQGGDEFIAFLPITNKHSDNSDAGQIEAIIAQRILNEIQQPFVIENQETYVSASIGISLFPSDAQEVKTLIQYADSAMYRAKELGRGNYQYFSKELSDRQQKRISLATQLHKAIELHEFVLYYQPLIELSSGKMVGVEALIRWQQGNGQIVPPADFLPIAEDTGLILPIGEWVIREACRQAHEWNSNGASLRVAINLSARQIWLGDIDKLVLSIVNDIGVSRDAIEFEITESAMVIDPERMNHTLERFKYNNIQLSLDDFGTGYSSLDRLKHLPFHKLKIDKSFVDEIPNDKDNTAIVTATIQMARSLDICSLAEGIETHEQARFLKESGCNFGQGFFFSQPISAAEIGRLLDQNHSWQL